MKAQFRHVLSRCFFWGVPLLALAWLVGVTVKDRSLVTTYCFYVPPTLVIPLCLAWLWSTRRTASAGLRWLCALISIVALVKVLVVDFSWKKEGRLPPNHGVRIAQWNVAHGHFGPVFIFNMLSRHDVDIAVLNEYPGGGGYAKAAETWLKINGRPDRNIYKAGNLVLVSVHPVVHFEELDLPEAQAFWARIGTLGGTVEIVGVDFESTPWRSRRERIERLAELIPQRENPAPLVLLGDFNTQRDSSQFEPLREHLVHAFEWRGRGSAYTWPLFPWPMYAIDHIWVTPGVRLFKHEVRRHWSSDHALQYIDMQKLPRPKKHRRNP